MGVTIYTKRRCPYCERATAVLRAKNVVFREIDITDDPAGQAEMVARSGGRRTVPQVFIGGKHVGGADALAELDRKGKLDALLRAAELSREEKDMEPQSPGASGVRNVVILGSGPAGLTAAIYAARAGLSPIVVEGLSAGGQLMTTTEVENYPGFPEGLQGPEMMERFKKQASRFGTEFVAGDATKVDFAERPFRIWVGERVLLARAVIIATGASPRRLNVPGEQEYAGRGVSYCATCDGFFFRGQPIIVVGGGDSAMEEALFLSRFGTKVTIVHRRDRLRASKIMADRAMKNDKIEFVWDTVVEEVLGDGQKVTGVRLRNVKTGERSEIPCGGFFVAIGHVPNTRIFRGILPMDEQGYLQVESPSTRTAIPGVFAAGDVHDRVYRQAVTAAGEGCKAAIDCERWLEAEGH